MKDYSTIERGELIEEIYRKDAEIGRLHMPPTIEELFADNARLRAEIAHHHVEVNLEKDRLCHEAKSLRAENEHLRARLDKIAEHPDTTELIRQYAQGRIGPAEGE